MAGIRYLTTAKTPPHSDSTGVPYYSRGFPPSPGKTLTCNVIGSQRSRAGNHGYLGVGSRFPDTVKDTGPIRRR